MQVRSAAAAGETRTLKLYFVHTGERAEITFKRNGRFDPKGLQELNRFLRDWRRNEPTRMDPRLFDLVWEVYRRVGATDYIHVVSAYRSPTTNGMLRSRTKGVAKNSQHMLGKAMDFFIPGVKLATLRRTAMQMQVGGVGFYPTSGSPFVHLDVGSVRAWPRMQRDELVQLFPNGNTMHIPADGKPLPGYEQAVADYKRRVGSESIQIAGTAGGAASSSQRKRPDTLMAMLFGGSGDEDEDAESIAAPEAAPQRPAVRAPVQQAAEPEEETAPAAPVATAPVAVAALAPDVTAPVPLARPAFRDAAANGGLATALLPSSRNAAQEALQAALPVAPAMPMARPDDGAAQPVDLAGVAVPVPTLLGPRRMQGDAEPSGIVTASVNGGEAAGVLLASVPVPAHRPDSVAPPAPSVATAAASGPQPVPPLSRQPVLTPTMLVEVARSANYYRTAAHQPAPAEPSVEVASAEQPSANDEVGRMIFNDGFDPPKASGVGAPGKVVKGGAVTKLGGTPANPGTKVLTGNMLAAWATATRRTDAVASMKAPRLITRAISSDYSAAYSEGFKPVSTTANIDPNRFSGANPAKP
ncbi:DUF882 domain-containing protein [Rhizobium sp. CSW-27]|uniref:DUF882 domain-containing protein n=1 Tax=Rhizobium sp. CSW-27 TaxID=2839985 RepID=UPI001C025A1F|nr:DUF882 domain-containing protein [Rhizobium sp. CSW-27]MBT9369307.1 DUF882 domain-containing protein [Rhizobium sp. CSW-27]